METLQMVTELTKTLEKLEELEKERKTIIETLLDARKAIDYAINQAIQLPESMLNNFKLVKYELNDFSRKNDILDQRKNKIFENVRDLSIKYDLEMDSERLYEYLLEYNESKQLKPIRSKQCSEKYYLMYIILEPK